MSEKDRCEWDELIQGKYMYDLEDALLDLQGRAASVAMKEAGR
jgi:hypothetical protein